MHLPEKPVDADGGGGARQVADKLPLTGRGGSGAARQLDRVGCIKDNRAAQLAHDDKRTHIGYQVVIAEARAPFGQNNIAVAGRLDLANGIFHVERGHKLPLLHIDDPAGPAGSYEQIGLARKKRRNLDDIENLGSRVDLADVMHIGHDRQRMHLLDAGKDPQPFRHARSAKGIDRSPVRLVV